MTDTEMILEALNSFKNDVNARFDKIENEMNTMKADMNDMKAEMNDRFDKVETKVTRLELIVENDIRNDIRKLSDHQLGLREQLEEYKSQVDDRLGTNDLVNLLADYSRKHC